MHLSIRDPRYRETLAIYTLGALARDLGSGDVTTNILFPKKIPARAVVIAKEDGMFAGGEEAMWFLRMLRKKAWKLSGRLRKKDGARFHRSDVLLTLSGDGRVILKVERTLLNLLQRMCSIATYTNRLRKKIPRGVSLAATRKTLWGLLDKKAVLVGGGDPHRRGLFDTVLVKDNHRHLAHDRVQQWMRRLGKTPCEIEVETIRDALRIGASLLKRRARSSGLLLDNFPPKALRRTVQRLRERFRRQLFLEASGGITEKNLRAYARTGVDRVSMSALTISPPPLDLTLSLTPP